jgi:uncharacterized Zn finger protein
MSWWSYRPRQSVASIRSRATARADRLRKKGQRLAPVILEGRTIARSFWGKAWCQNLEAYRDYAYRLPRGRSYLSHRAVIDLKVTPGSIEALVCGSELYNVAVKVRPLNAARWARIRARCAGEIGSLIDLLQGRLSGSVMQIVTDRNHGLFPRPAEIDMHCSCPDWATMCKHVAAAMYGVGARLEREPELLFVLRKVDHLQLIAAAADVGGVTRVASGAKTIAPDSVANVFGIDFEPEVKKIARPGRSPARKKKSTRTRKAKVNGGTARSRFARVKGRSTGKD